MFSQSHTYFSGHVRATTAGSLSLDNCHPFVHGKLMVSVGPIYLGTSNLIFLQFMHNGGIADFPLIKRKLQAVLSDDVFNVVQGNTGERSGFIGSQLELTSPHQIQNGLSLCSCRKYDSTFKKILIFADLIRFSSFRTLTREVSRQTPSSRRCSIR